MLPRPRCMRVTQPDWSTSFDSANAVRYDALLRTVAPTDYIASPSARRSKARTAPKIGLLIGREHQFCRRLGTGIRIRSAEVVILAIRPNPFLVTVTFV